MGYFYAQPSAFQAVPGREKAYFGGPVKPFLRILAQPGNRDFIM